MSFPSTSSPMRIVYMLSFLSFLLWSKHSFLLHSDKKKVELIRRKQHHNVCTIKCFWDGTGKSILSFTFKILRVVYDLKFVGPLEFKLVAPMPEQLKTTAMHFYSPGDARYTCYRYTSEKCIVVVPTCSGMGATKFKFWVLRS